MTSIILNRAETFVASLLQEASIVVEKPFVISDMKNSPERDKPNAGVVQIYFPHKFISVAQVSVTKEIKLCGLRIKLFPDINLFS